MPSSLHSVSLKDHGQQLHLSHADGDLTLEALWLRERSPDETTLDSLTGPRLIEAADLPLDLSLTQAQLDGDTLSLAFSDGHAASFSLAALLAECQPCEAYQGMTFWQGSLAQLPEADFAAALEEDAALLDMLEQLQRFGFVRVSGVPDTEDGMQGLIHRIGPLRRTNWGGIADVKSVANAYDLTMTQRGLEPHTDNPYRDPIPGYIWLHCLRNAAQGGDSMLVDGFSAAEHLRREDPEAFACLTDVSPGFRYHDATTRLESEGPLIELDSRGQVARVRFSNRTERVPALPEVPTFAEAGFPGYAVNAWFGLLARKGTPPEAIEAWNRGVRAALDMQDVRQKLSGWGAIPVGNTPAQFAAYLKAEDQKWARVIRDAGIRID